MIITRAPVRISFFGGGTDYPEHFRQAGGAVLATAINKFSYVTVSHFPSHLFDYSIRISYRKSELVRRVDEIEHKVFRACLERCGLARDIEIHSMADLPAFTGLGSSSTFTVSLLHALHSAKGEFVTPLQLACEAIHVERGMLRESVGCQDQVMAAFGGFNLVEFRTEEDILVHRVPLSPGRLAEFEGHLHVVFTGVRRKASEVVARQLERLPRNGATLRAMRAMVDRGWAILTGAGSLEPFGALLHEAWMAKRSLEQGVSTPAIDALYEAGRAAGAWGGKLLGAGGGGFLLFFAPPEARPKLAAAFFDRHLLSLRIGAPGSEIIFSQAP